MKTISWMGAALAALALAGCATGERQPAPGGAATHQDARRPLAGTYRVPGPADKNRGKGSVFYLVRDGAQPWRIGFDAEEFKRLGGERLQYWPQGKMVAMDFDHTADWSTTRACNDSARDRARQGYTVCTSAFRTADTSGVLATVRVLAGVTSAGLSEISAAQEGRKYERADIGPMLAELERLDLDRQFWLKDYRERSAARNASGLADFVRRYERDDPDQLVGQARAAMAVLARNAQVLEQVERATPALERYRQRYMPANPKKYCNGLKADGEDYRMCQAEVSAIVAALADRRAAAARRQDMCLGVSKAVGAGAQAQACQDYAAGSCRATGDKGGQVCDILNRKGQS